MYEKAGSSLPDGSFIGGLLARASNDRNEHLAMTVTVLKSYPLRGCRNFRLAVILAGSLPGRTGGASGLELDGRASRAVAGTWLMECLAGIFLEYPGSERGRHVRRTWSYPRKSSGQEGYRVA